RRDWLRWAALCARIALGAAFLSGIADRFGLYRGRNVGYGDFAGFVRYTAKVNSFMPPSTIPFLAWAATITEFFFGIALILGIWRVWVALGSAVLLILFGTAMAISFGFKSPLDYSVFRHPRLPFSVPRTRVGARSGNEPAGRERVRRRSVATPGAQNRHVARYRLASSIFRFVAVRFADRRQTYTLRESDTPVVCLMTRINPIILVVLGLALSRTAGAQIQRQDFL